MRDGAADAGDASRQRGVPSKEGEPPPEWAMREYVEGSEISCRSCPVLARLIG